MTLTLNIPDEVLKKGGISEQEMRTELACRLFDAQRLTKFEACVMAGLTREEFNAALVARNLPVVRYTEEMLREDLGHAGVKLRTEGEEA